MAYRSSFVAVLVLLLAPFSAWAADISGTWAAAFDTQIGKQEYTYQFVVKGSTLTGTAKSANGESPIVDGKVEGNLVTFVENLKYQGQDLKITYTGTVASDKEIKFTCKVADVAVEELVATRTK